MVCEAILLWSISVSEKRPLLTFLIHNSTAYLVFSANQSRTCSHGSFSSIQYIPGIMICLNNFVIKSNSIVLCSKGTLRQCIQKSCLLYYLVLTTFIIHSILFNNTRQGTKKLTIGIGYAWLVKQLRGYALRRSLKMVNKITNYQSLIIMVNHIVI